MKMTAVFLLLAVTLAGCEYAQTIGAGIVDRVQLKNDLVLDATIAKLCGTPYSAIKRNAGKYPALSMVVQIQCGPL